LELEHDEEPRRVHIWKDISSTHAELMFSFNETELIPVGHQVEKKNYTFFFNNAFQSESYDEVYQEACFRML
jgi:hypothetical protein